MYKTALILGATGLTGGLILDKLLTDNRYSQIKIFSRKYVNIVNPKIIEYVGDLFELEKFKKDFTANEVFCCIGTTANNTPDKIIYRKIDYGIPVAAAKLCKENGIDTFLVVSSLGADSKSSIFYNRTKGDMEQAVLNENILNTYILRPSIILGKRNENRIGENIGKALFNIFQFLLIGKLKKYRAIEADIIASSMIHLANNRANADIIESDKITDIAVI